MNKITVEQLLKIVHRHTTVVKIKCIGAFPYRKEDKVWRDFFITEDSGKNEMEWKTKGYYGDLKSAIGGVLKHCLMALSTEEISTLSELIERIDEIEKELKGAIKNEK